MIPLSWYLRLSAALFSIGLFGVMARRNAIVVLMGVELMLNAVNINLIAFWRYLTPDRSVGLVWATFVLTVAAAEALPEASARIVLRWSCSIALDMSRELGERAKCVMRPRLMKKARKRTPSSK